MAICDTVVMERLNFSLFWHHENMLMRIIKFTSEMDTTLIFWTLNFDLGMFFISFCVRLVYESWVNRMHGTVSYLLPIPATFLLWWEELLLQYDECHETHFFIGKSDLKKLQHPISDTFHALSRGRLIPRTSLAG